MEPTQEPAPDGRVRPLAGWLERKDPGLRATKRSVRAAVVVPAVFAVSQYGTSNHQTPLFAVFGSVSLLLFADFGGPLRVRARSYLGLWVVGCVFISLGTLCSRHTVAAVAGMAVATFAVLFAGTVSPAAVAGSTAALLTFVLPVAEPAAASAIGDRLLGWALAGAVCIPVSLFVWAGRWHDRLRHAMADASTALADLARASVAHANVTADCARVEAALGALRDQYEATPYRPTGAGPTDVALTNMVSRLEWVGARAVEATTVQVPDDESAAVSSVYAAAADVLAVVADVLAAPDPRSHPAVADRLARAVDRLASARVAATDLVLASLVVETADPDPDPDTALARVDPTYPVRMLAFALEMMADVALAALGAPGVDAGRLDRWAATERSFLRVVAGNLTFRSVWFRNSVRGAVALALAVLVIEEISVQHGFWVVLGTLSVLRSNALGTGSTALRAVVGTAIGFGVGALALEVIGLRGDGLWVVLPFAVLVAGIAPTTISFTAGQAGFTVLVVLVFNIIDPVGSIVGLIRVEDVLIGAGVSLVVGLLFWPRGAAAQLARALAQSYSAATAWLVVAVDQVGRAGPVHDVSTWTPAQMAAMDAARRLDDAYRQFLGERGAKQVPLPIVTRLLTGSARIRLTAVTLEGLPDLTVPGGPEPLSEVVTARSVVREECADVESWFEGFSSSLGGRHPTDVPAPMAGGRTAPELAAAWSAVRRAGRRDGVFAVLRLLWVEQRLDDLLRLQDDLAGTVPALTGPLRR